MSFGVNNLRKGLLLKISILAHTLRLWSLLAEFTARDATQKSTLQDYLNQEKRLFAELKEKIYDRVKAKSNQKFCRYRAGGLQDPGRWETNWNRTFELVPEHIQGGALLLHGLTDSPYSLRKIGEILHAKGFYVLGLRLPAHRTIPLYAFATIHSSAIWNSGS